MQIYLFGSVQISFALLATYLLSISSLLGRMMSHQSFLLRSMWEEEKALRKCTSSAQLILCLLFPSFPCHRRYAPCTAPKSPWFFPLQFWQLCHFWPLFLSLWQQESACLVVWWGPWCFESQPGFARAGTSLQLLPLLEPLVGHSSSVLLIWCHPWLMETHKTARGKQAAVSFVPLFMKQRENVAILT